MKEYRVHPAAEVFPVLDEERLQALADDIEARGLRVPITIWKDEAGEEWLLDGRNRVRACALAGIEPTIDYYSGEDPWGEAWSRNAERRDIEPGRRTAIRLLFNKGRDDWKRERAARLAKKVAGVAPGGNVAPRSESAREQQKTRAALAREADVSPRTAQKALTVDAEDPALLKRVADGEVSLGNAAREVSRRKRAAKPQRGNGRFIDRKLQKAIAAAKVAVRDIERAVVRLDALPRIPASMADRLRMVAGKINVLIEKG